MSLHVKCDPDLLAGFETALAGLPDGCFDGVYLERTWGVTIRRSEDGRRVWLFAEERGGTDIVSFNLYVLAGRKTVLKPCEMSSEKVVDFVAGFCRSSREDVYYGLRNKSRS